MWGQGWCMCDTSLAAWDRCRRDLADSPSALTDAPPGLDSVGLCSWPDGHSITSEGHSVKPTVSNFDSLCTS